MKNLKKIKLEEISNLDVIKERVAVRAVLQDVSGMVPLLFVSKFEYYKLPGGGIEESENHNEALKRECMEELGSTIEIISEIGEIEEYRAKWNLLQKSYCYFGKVIEKGTPNFTEGEIEEGFEVVWYSYEEAVKAVREASPKNYEGIFVQERDLAFLETVSSII